jgi:hypothetical protein
MWRYLQKRTIQHDDVRLSNERLLNGYLPDPPGKVIPPGAPPGVKAPAPDEGPPPAVDRPCGDPGVSEPTWPGPGAVFC